MMKSLFLFMFLVSVLGITVVAQQASSGGTKAVTEIIAMSSTQTVKNSPFSADAVSESVEVLADGNRITRSVTHKLYRDSDGRFRREEVSTPGGNNLRLFGSQSVFISDPTSNSRVVLDPTTKTAQRGGTVSKNGIAVITTDPISEDTRTAIETRLLSGSTRVALPTTVTGTGTSIDKSESLGVRDFEGIPAEGTRTVMTIAAGAIGNERPIETVYERWYSKDLQLIVYSKHTDPRFGEQTYRLTNINRSEPDRSLFTVSPDYKVNAERTLVMTKKPE